MKRSLAAAALAGALTLAPIATANAQHPAPAPAQAAATPAAAEPVALPPDFNPFHVLLELLHTGSSSLSGGAKSTAAPVASGFQELLWALTAGSSSASAEDQACRESYEGLMHGCPGLLQRLLGSGSAK
ncbi:hypothetical protein AB0H76_01075 [Nocardia sp. NPDC050712]|uniref:hypothetical protein n=1 Tax=Nocardia sp. NPDC050712 TaxID=3155518 RepID=UPI0033C768DB